MKKRDSKASPPVLQSSSLQVIFLGTNGWYDTETGDTVSTLVKCREFDLILDAGSGLAKLDKYCDFKKPVYLLLSHLHLDHITGLHTLAKFNFKKGLEIIVSGVYKKELERFLAKPYTVPLKGLPYKAGFAWLPGKERFPFGVETLPLKHTDPVSGFRFRIEGKTLSYVTDTGYCPNALKLARGADLLITECSYRKGEKNDGWPHFNPETAARLAKEAGAHKLVLTHFAADKYRGKKDRKRALETARRIFPAVKAAEDGLSVKI